MICPGCGAKNTEHAYSRTENPPCASWPKCIRCGEAHNGGASYVAGPERDICGELGVCYVCAIREHEIRKYEAGKLPHLLIIDGNTYSADRANTVPLGNPDPHPTQRWRGMAGRRFDFQRLDGSPPVSCYSLWYGSQVQPSQRHRMPDNARFLNGAEQTQAGDTVCFNGSRAARNTDKED